MKQKNAHCHGCGRPTRIAAVILASDEHDYCDDCARRIEEFPCYRCDAPHRPTNIHDVSDHLDSYATLYSVCPTCQKEGVRGERKNRVANGGDLDIRPMPAHRITVYVEGRPEHHLMVGLAHVPETSEWEPAVLCPDMVVRPFADVMLKRGCEEWRYE